VAKQENWVLKKKAFFTWLLGFGVTWPAA